MTDEQHQLLLYIFPTTDRLLLRPSKIQRPLFKVSSKQLDAPGKVLRGKKIKLLQQKIRHQNRKLNSLKYLCKDIMRKKKQLLEEKFELLMLDKFGTYRYLKI